MLGGLDLLQVLIRPPPALAQQLEEVGVLVGERMVVDGVEHGHGGPFDLRCWSAGNGVRTTTDDAVILAAAIAIHDRLAAL
ncbi:hypothetical protein ACWIHQ_40380 [Streptomyces anulatus]